MMRRPERRLIALLVGVGVAGLGTLSKLTALLALPGWLLASSLENVIHMPGAFWFIVVVANFIVWATGTYLFLTWKERRRPVA
jgi:hypothetical protein